MVHPSTKSLGLVISAIKSLREIQGSTSREILQYLSSVHDIPATKARRQVQSALKRGVTYGILKKVGGHYSLPTDSDLARQEVAIQEIDLLDLYCQRKANRPRDFKAPSEKCGRRSRRAAGGCKCAAKRRRRRRSRGCGPKSCGERRGGRGGRRRRSRKRGGGCKCGSHGGCGVREETVTHDGSRDWTDELIGSGIEAEATAVINTERDGRSSLSDSSSPERMAANDNSEQQDRDAPMSR